MKKLALVTLVSMFLVGCAGGPKASLEEDQMAKQFNAPTDGTANLYIYRNENFGGAINMDILVDNQRVATTGPKTYIMKNLRASEHKIEGIAAEGTSILTVSLLPNTIKFVWQEVKMGIFGARNKLQEVSEEKGKEGVLESSLLVSTPIKISTEKEVEQTDYKPAIVAKVKKNSAKKQDRKQFQKQTKRQKNYYGVCPCQAGAACYGPRGGRYCYTSGGNKRYF